MVKHTWFIALATAGLVIIGLEAVLVAPASAALTSALRGGWTLSFQSIAVQILLVGVMVSVLAVRLASRSRVAYVAVLIIGLVPTVTWAYLLAIGDAVARQPLTLVLVTPSILVVVGLIQAWDAYWSPTTGPMD